MAPKDKVPPGQEKKDDKDGDKKKEPSLFETWFGHFYQTRIDELRELYPDTYVPDAALAKLERSVRSVERLTK